MFNKFSEILQKRRKRSWIQNLRKATMHAKIISPTVREQRISFAETKLELIAEDMDIDPNSLIKKGFLLQLNKEKKIPNSTLVLQRAYVQNQKNHAMIEWYGVDFHNRVCIALSQETDNIENYLNHGIIITEAIYDICLAIISVRKKTDAPLETFAPGFYDKDPEKNYVQFFQSLFGKNEVNLPEWWPEESHIVILHMKK